ncbi:hypothetical protein ACWEVD_18785 [Nocardia thailandica]
MLVDPDELRALSSALDSIVGEISELGIDVAGLPSVSALGSPALVEAVKDAVLSVNSSWAAFGGRCAEVSSLSAGVGRAFEISDSDFSQALQKIGGSS